MTTANDITQADFDLAWSILACRPCRNTYACSEGEGGNKWAIQGAAECGSCLAELIAGLRQSQEGK